MESQVLKSDTSVPNKPPSIRYLICTWGLIALALSSMSRTILNQAIDQMVHKDQKSERGSCPVPQQPATTPLPPSLLTIVTPLANLTSNPLPLILQPQAQGDNNKKETQKDPSSKAKFYWTPKQQRIVLGSFYLTYFLFMFIGGRMSELYGSKYVILLAGAGCALVNVATPSLNTLYLIVASRLFMGFVQAGIYPAMYALIKRWVTSTETEFFTPMIRVNLRLGMLVGSGLPWLLNFFKRSWEDMFYVAGAICVVWSVAWVFLAESDPQNSVLVSDIELGHIVKKKQIIVEVKDKNNAEKETKKTPWIRIITHPSVIALIFAKIGYNIAFDFTNIYLPQYLALVHHATIQQKGFITIGVAAIQLVFGLIVPLIVKQFVRINPFGMTKTNIRKFFQTIANGGMALSLFMATFNNCGLLIVLVAFYTFALMSCFASGGEVMFPYDLSEKYPATIVGIANSFANLASLSVSFLADFILGDETSNFDRWNNFMLTAAGAAACSGLFFALVAKAETVDFDKPIIDTKSIPVLISNKPLFPLELPERLMDASHQQVIKQVAEKKA